MLRTVSAQPTLWESILPEQCLGMPAELVAVDRLLDDARFFEPYRAFFHATIGRPSIPIETYLRLMFLKYRYKLGFEPLCREVQDSISWARFCRIPLGGRVPHPTTPSYYAPGRHGRLTDSRRGNRCSSCCNNMPRCHRARCRLQ